MKNKIKYIILSMAIVLFILILSLILTDKITGFDTTIYEFITLKKNDTITNIYKCITFFGSTTFIVILCLLFLLIFWKQKKGFVISACLIGSTLINNLIKVIVRRNRPVDLMLVEENTFSFPSGHTMASVSMYGLLIYLVWQSKFSKKLKIILTILLSVLILAIASSRIYLGAHYASDIIGAILMSTIWLIIFINILKNKNII